MTMTTILRRLGLLTPLVLALLPGPAAAAPAEQATAATTLDVCQNGATGNWRYSGVVSVRNGAATDTSVFNVAYWIQNKIAQAPFLDAYQAPVMPDQLMLTRTSQARVIPFSIEAPPLILGAVRNMSRVAIYDPLNAATPAIRFNASSDLTASVCGCEQPKGCTRTQGYWGNKPDVVWPSGYSRSAMFFSSGLSWQAILDTPPKGGNGYLILAHQYIAAVLNKAKPATVPLSVQNVLTHAATWFNGGTTPDNCASGACETQKTWAGILDTYNNGEYPGGPGHCVD